MSYVAAESNIRQPTVSNDAVYAKFAGKPLQGYEAVFLQLAAGYQIDPNWALAYLQWESAFGSSSVGRANPSNPWDILCYPGQWGQAGEYRPGNGYCYAVYPDVRTGLEAGFRLWSHYVDLGYGSWWASLSRALCGNAEGCGGSWVDNVIAQGQYNAGQWPYDGSQPPPAVGPGQMPGPGVPQPWPKVWEFIKSPVGIASLALLGVVLAGSGGGHGHE